MDPSKPVDPDEVILRRVPEARMSTDRRSVLPDAFAPHKTTDADGLSVDREIEHSPEEAGRFRTRGTTPCWVIAIPARKLFELGLTIRPDPRPAEEGLPPRPGHALIPELNSANRDSENVLEMKQRLAAISTEAGTLHGPFSPPTTR